MPAELFTPYTDEDPEAERIERELLTLYAHISAATYRFLCLLNEYDERKAWHGAGMRSFAHWLNWRCGIGLTAAREKIRVAKALADLPNISSAFRVGTLSYSKVRALTRVATPKNEDTLLGIAQSATASQMERLCKGLRKCESIEDAGIAHRRRELSYYVDDDGSVVIRGRLPAEGGELVLQALEAAGECLNIEHFADEAENDDAECRFQASRADALMRLAESYLAHGSEALSGGERHGVVIHVNPEALRQDGKDSLNHASAEAPRAKTERGGGLTRETARRLSCDASLLAVYETTDGEPLTVGRRTRSIPPAIRRTLTLRDKGCRFPACTERRFVDAHHVHHWADGGHTAMDNLVTLCRHHHRLVHEQGFTVEMLNRSPHFFTPGGARVPENGQDTRFCGNAFALRAMNAASAPDIGPGSLIPDWHGESLDLPYVTGVLMQSHLQEEDAPPAEPD